MHDENLPQPCVSPVMPDRLPAAALERSVATKRPAWLLDSRFLCNLGWPVILCLDHLLGDVRSRYRQHIASCSRMELLKDCHLLLLIGRVAQRLVDCGQPKMRNVVSRLDPNRCQQMAERFPRSSLTD